MHVTSRRARRFPNKQTNKTKGRKDSLDGMILLQSIHLFRIIIVYYGILIKYTGCKTTEPNRNRNKESMKHGVRNETAAQQKNPDRVWVCVQQDQHQQQQSFGRNEDKENLCFSCITYNVLSSTCLKYHESYYTMPWNDDHSRMERVWEQLRAYDADIVCLQEVDRDALHPHNDGGFVLSDRYMLGGFYVGSSDGQGVAVLYKGDRFACRKKTVLKYSDACSDQGAVVLTLRFLGSPGDRDIVVAGTHLYWEPAQTQIKQQQCRELVACINTHMDQLDGEKQGGIVILGDLNDVHAGEDESPTWLLGREYLGTISAVHQLGFPTIPHTTSTPWFAGCLDYIMYSKSRFERVPRGYLEFYQTCFDPKPSMYFPRGDTDPSDHIAVGCILSILP